MEEPTNKQILDAVSASYVSDPDLGATKVPATLKAENNWDLSNKQSKKLLEENEKERQGEGVTDNDTNGGAEQQPQTLANKQIDPSNVTLPPIQLPKDAHGAQVRYMDTSRRCFKIYGRGEYDYGVTPNMDQQLLIGICHNRLVKWGAPGPWNEELKMEIARTSEMNTIWNYWWAAGRKAGLTEEDIGRQLEAEYGVDPTPWLPILTNKQIERRKAEFKDQSMAMKRAMLRELPEARQHIAIDARGEPIWNEKIHGEYTVLVVKINKGDGLTEYGPIDD